MVDDTPWLALVVGNSRLHWGSFAGAQWLGGWHTPQLTSAQGHALMTQGFTPQTWTSLAAAMPELDEPELPPMMADFPELWLASVVQAQGNVWRTYAQSRVVTTDQVPLGHGYPTLGVDRALALVGAGETYGWPVLVVDGGTALTLTAGAERRLVGGAILPGVRSQFRALHDYTDGLPLLSYDLAHLPPRWATTTAEAMTSGILYSQLAGLRDFITDWWQGYGQGQRAGRVVFTGGDGPALASALTRQNPAWATSIRVDPDLMFWGLRVCRQRQTQQ